MLLSGAAVLIPRLIDPGINDALRIVTGCLRPTPADAGIRPAELRRNGATLYLARRAMEPAGFPRGIESIEKVFNFKIHFQDLEKVLNLAKDV